MPILEVKIENLDALKRALRDYPKIANPIAANAINSTLGVMHRNATKPTVPWRTGFLAASFARGIRLATPTRLWGSISPTVKYAIWVHEGTRPHAITARNARALAIPIGAGAGDVYIGRFKRKRRVKVHVGKRSRLGIAGQDFIFRRSVQHPGSRANPFMERIIQKSTLQINQIFKNAYDSIVGEIAKRTNLG